MLRQLLALPTFDDREKQRAARTLFGVAVSVAAGCVVWVVVNLLNEWGPLRTGVAAGMLIVSLVVMRLAQAGQAFAGSMLLLVTGTTLATLHLILAEDGVAPTLGAYYILVSASGLLLGARAAVICGIVSAGILFGFAAWDGINLLPTPGADQSEWDVARANTVALVVISALFIFSTRQIREAFAQADRSFDELEAANEALRESQDQVLRAQKLEAVGTLSGAVAHDFNNYLTVIDGYAGMLEDGSLSDEERLEYTAEIRHAAERSARLTRELLALGRRQVFEPAPIDLDTVVTEMRKMIESILGAQTHLELACNTGGRCVQADRAQLEQAILNMALNARDAMPEGGTLNITTAAVELGQDDLTRLPALRPGPHVALTISDSGTGMPADVLERVFEPFFTTKGLARGSGLGLSSVQAIVHRSGGDLHIQSAPGKGTTVRCLFPEVAAEAQAPTPTESIVTSLDGLCVLLVDDDDSVRHLMCRLLERSGCKVAAYSDPEDVIQKGASAIAGVDLLITDVVMPHVGGAALAERLRGYRPDLPVLFISGYLEGSMVEQGKLETGVELLSKPFTEQALFDRIRGILRAE